MESRPQLARGDARSALETKLAQLRNQRTGLLAEIEGMGNGTAERAAALASGARRLKSIERQIARSEVALLTL